MKPDLKPADLEQLLQSLDQEYPEWVGQHNSQPREEAIFFIASKLHLTHDVAREVLEDLEAAGHTALIDPQLQRGDLRVWWRP
jgi:hypothetical protein